MDFYGADAAVDVTIEVFIRVNLRDTAAQLREERQKALGPDQTLGRRAEGYREKYTEHVQDKYGVIKDRNSLLGQNIILDSRYTKLIIVEETRARKEREHEIMASGQRHAEIMSEQKRSITIGDLFAADEKGKTQRIIVLLGAAGIGKTLTAKKIMFDWATGKLYNEAFDYVFYINCREVNFDTEEGSVANLILRNCPDQHAPIEAMLVNPERLLFIIDGFDELRFSLDQPEENLCSDPWEKKPMEIVLSSLVWKKVLEKCSLLITTRPAALEELRQCLHNERCAEILGFSETERREYFDKYFGDKGKARKAFNFVKRNEMLFTMCFVPIVCWIVCTVIKQQMDEDGVCRQKILFGAEELQKHGLETDSLLLQFCDFRYEAPDEDVSRSPKQPPLEQETHSPIYLLCQALKDPHCKVKRLWLQWCVLTPTCCRDLVAVLSTCPSLTELDLSHNTRVGDGGVQLLCEGLRHPSCKLQTLRLWNCRLTPTCCGALTAVLSTSPSLMELDLSYNGDLGDGGVRLLCEGLRHPSCKLQTLRLQWCGLTDTCCEDLAAALSTSPSLTELDLTHNSGLGAGGVQLLCEGLRQPSCKLQTLG
ncbi:hypothetical protein Y1Q_0008583 [Alligator mississippiensis]|uniref:NACHT domain-containing protein n=1 Tax=Alligator mississippiensis TaxID=8496 RepID=A0A151MSE8_ALLMI|nr:hypothetical protein Y1Q_0008583 [Alligator mississippiensis]